MTRALWTGDEEDAGSWEPGRGRGTGCTGWARRLQALSSEPPGQGRPEGLRPRRPRWAGPDGPSLPRVPCTPRFAARPCSRRPGTGTSDTQLPARQQGQSPAPVNWRRLTWRIRSLLMHTRCAHGGREGPSDGAEVTQLGNDRGRPGPGPAGTLLQAARWAPKVWGSGSGLGLQRQ